MNMCLFGALLKHYSYMVNKPVKRNILLVMLFMFVFWFNLLSTKVALFFYISMYLTL